MARDKSSWRPLQRAARPGRATDEQVRRHAHRLGIDETAARAMLEAEAGDVEYWINDLYQVAKRRCPAEMFPIGVPMIHLNIRRRDGKVVFRDWRHFQWIKNQLVGPEHEAVEIYPAESRLSDTSNKYHLWAFADPKQRIPFGMLGRDVMDDDGDRTPGTRQRRLT